MNELGYELVDQSFQLPGGKGIDLVFKNTKTGQFAITEAKHGTGLSNLAIDSQGLRQGALRYNEDRLQKFIDAAEAGKIPNANVQLAEDILGAGV